MANLSITNGGFCDQQSNLLEDDVDSIYIIRHGFREDWVNPAWKEDPQNKFDDPPLSELGLKQGWKMRLLF